MNKNILTNIIAALILGLGFVLDNTILMWVGLFALSGALTNWLAVHMLFEKIPGLVGSGVIPNRFEEFKAAIRQLMMEQFFSKENIDKFISDSTEEMPNINLTPVIEKVDLSPFFDKLVTVIMSSSLGKMLGMLGGKKALKPLKKPFVSAMKASLIELTEKESFIELLKEQMQQPDIMPDIQAKVAEMIDARLEELTPEMVKEMVQKMIKEHLGWLVVWGGVFGGLIGLISTTFMSVFV